MKTIIITLFALMCSIAPLRSQIYSFQATTVPYADLVNPISLNNGEVWEMPDYTIPIGFDFWYFYEYIDTLYFFPESTAMFSTSNEEGGFHKLLIPFGAILIDRGYGTSQSLSPLSYELSGEPGNAGNPVMVQTDEFTFLEGSIPPNTVFQFNNLTAGSLKKTLNTAIVYPNPAKDYLTIRLRNNFTSLAEISICDINGRIVYQSAQNPNQTGELQVPVSAIKSGVYQVVIRQGEGVTSARLVKL